VISTCFVFAHTGLSIPESASPPTPSATSAVLSCSILLAALCLVSAALVTGGGHVPRHAQPSG
jgi:hypothetical protein